MNGRATRSPRWKTQTSPPVVGLGLVKANSCPSGDQDVGIPDDPPLANRSKPVPPSAGCQKSSCPCPSLFELNVSRLPSGVQSGLPFPVLPPPDVTGVSVSRERS